MRRGSLAVWVVLGLLLALPPALQALDQAFYIGLAARFLIYAMAAASLNFILGHGGMLSFGHAAFVGTGAYTVAILAAEGVGSAWIAWPAATLVAGVAALVIGALSLRTRGVYFIMITLAFAQMLYYVFVSLKGYGGDDGLRLAARSDPGLGLDLKDEFTWYYTCLALLVMVMAGLNRLVAAPFGFVLDAIRINEARMEALGYATWGRKLAAFALAGALAGLAGALLANHSGYVSPKLMHWTQSGMLMVMVIVGGAGHRYGGVIGAIVLLALEEVMAEFTAYPQLGVGVALLAVVLLAPRGLMRLWPGSRQ